MEIKTKRTIAALLAVAGAVGTMATALLTRNAAKKEIEVQAKLQMEKKPGEGLSKKQILKAYAPIYTTPVAVGAATVASIVSSTILSRRTEASLAAMALLADQGWRKYKYQIKNKLGLDKHTDILKGIGKKDLRKRFLNEPEDTRQLYFEDHIGFFKADPEKFALAYSDLNQRLQLEDYGHTSFYTMLYNLTKAAEAEILNENIKPTDLRWGWSADYLKETCGYVWVHMDMFDTETESGKKFKTIVWGEEPFLDPGNFGETFLHDTEEDKERRKQACVFQTAIPKKKAAVIDYELD